MGFLDTSIFRNAVKGLALVTALLVPLPSSARMMSGKPVVKAVAKALPSVVNIRTETVQEVRDPFAELFSDFWNPYYRQPRQDVRRSLGSGVVIHEMDSIITNDHVVRRATKIRVKFANGREYEADRVAYDQRSDLALLRILLPKGSKTRFTPVPFARDGDLLLGETVIALGNPFGPGGGGARSAAAFSVAAIGRCPGGRDPRHGQLASDRCGHQSRQQRRPLDKSEWRPDWD